MKLYIGKWYYGWNIVIAATIITLITVGMRMGIGPFFLPMIDDLGMTRTALSFIIAVGMIVYGLGMPLVGYLERFVGTRYVLLIGVGIVVISCIWMVNARGTVSLLLSFGVLFSLGLSFTSNVALTPILSRWFTRQRGRALFYLSTGSMAGIAIMTPLFTMLIQAVGWQNTILVFAGIFILLVVPTAIWVIREHPPLGSDEVIKPTTEQHNKVTQASSEPETPAILTFKQAIKTWPFWQICLGLFTCGYSMTLIGTHGVPMLIDHGFSATVAAFAIGLIGLIAIPSTIILGSFADRISYHRMLATIYFVRGLGILALVLVASQTQLYTVTLIAGTVWAGSIALSAAIISKAYGTHLVGVLYGWTFFSHQIGAMISSLLGGLGYDLLGTHFISFGSATALLIVASLISLKK